MSPLPRARMLHLAALSLCSAAFAQAPAPADQRAALLVKADRIIVAPDVVLENDALLIRGGAVAFVGPEIPEAARRGATVVELEGTVVPGFVNPHTHLGLGADLAERTSALTPQMKAADAFDPFDEMLLLNARHGVTTLGLAPLSSNTFPGVAAAVRAGETGELVRDAAYMKVSLADESFDQERFPTSRMGAAELIRTSFDAARLAAAGSDPAAAALRDVLAGTTALAVHARSHGAITAALDLCQELGVAPLLIGADEADKSLPRLAALGGSVILGALSPSDPIRALELPAALEAAGVPFSFMADRAPPEPPAAGESEDRRSFGRGSRSGGPPSSRQRDAAPSPGHPAGLRLSAALAIRHGLSRGAALAALTRTPAAQCGLADRCGSLRQGCAADFAVFSGDPLDLTSRLVAVYVGGRRIDLEEER